MAKRISKEDWFAAASAQDLWACCNIVEWLLPREWTTCGFAIASCEASEELFTELWITSEANVILDDAGDQAFLAAQIGCELAGL